MRLHVIIYFGLPVFIRDVDGDVLIPLASIILSGQPPDKMPAASGLSNFVRIMFGGIGASVTTTLWDRRSALHNAQLAEHTGMHNQVFVQSLQVLSDQLCQNRGAWAVISLTMSVQASTMAATDIFWLSAIMFLALVALVWLSKPQKNTVPLDAGEAH